ncbi:MAG: hypothetical protein JRJ47_04730 [Deltaproteobacteria bacterium]|nr:hypothetical protein [Deltaproteobacteria bacterium]
MKLVLDKHSYRSGEDLLNRKPGIRREIEGAILRPGLSVMTLSGMEYVEMIRQELLSKGWEDKPTLFDPSGDIVEAMDLRKEMVGVLFGIPSDSSPTDMIGFQTARKSPETEIDLGVYIVTTAECQTILAKSSGKPWAGISIESAVRNFSQINRQMLIPTCVIGLDLYESPLTTIDIDKTAPSIIKELMLAFLEAKYNTKILKNVCVKGDNAVMEFDGIARFGGKDTVLALELGGGQGNFPSRLRSNSLYGFANCVLEYQEQIGRELQLRFVLMGNFRPSYIDEMFGVGGTAMTVTEGIEVGYEIHSFDEFESFLLQKKQALAAP